MSQYKHPIQQIVNAVGLVEVEIENETIKVVKAVESSLDRYGIGDIIDGVRVLLPEEALFLAAISSLHINGKKVGVEDIVKRFDNKPELWSRFSVYWRLRENGYIVKKGFGGGIDYRLYDNNPEWREKGARYLVSIIREGKGMSFEQLARITELAKNMKKELVLALVSSQGEITFYRVSRAELKINGAISIRVLCYPVFLYFR